MFPFFMFHISICFFWWYSIIIFESFWNFASLDVWWFTSLVLLMVIRSFFDCLMVLLIHIFLFWAQCIVEQKHIRIRHRSWENWWFPVKMFPLLPLHWPASLNRLFHRTKPLPSITRMRELGPTQLADDSWENGLYYAHMLANGYNNYKM
jgi:hypothetical protein